MYAFNHDEAIRSFRRAAELDPECAMAWWGVSIAAGPQYNHPVMTEERTATAWDKTEETEVVLQRYRQAWKNADALTDTSCKCILAT